MWRGKTKEWKEEYADYAEIIEDNFDIPATEVAKSQLEREYEEIFTSLYMSGRLCWCSD